MAMNARDRADMERRREQLQQAAWGERITTTTAAKRPGFGPELGGALSAAEMMLRKGGRAELAYRTVEQLLTEFPAQAALLDVGTRRRVDALRGELRAVKRVTSEREMRPRWGAV